MTATEDLIWSELHPRAARPPKPTPGIYVSRRSFQRAAVALVAWHAEVLADRVEPGNPNLNRKKL